MTLCAAQRARKPAGTKRAKKGILRSAVPTSEAVGASLRCLACMRVFLPCIACRLTQASSVAWRTLTELDGDIFRTWLSNASDLLCQRPQARVPLSQPVLPCVC